MMCAHHFAHIVFHTGYGRPFGVGRFHLRHLTHFLKQG